MGKNLIAHLRSNLTFRVPRTAIPGLSAAVQELQTSALFVKGRAMKGSNFLGHFHLQITASGGGSNVGSEDELFQKIPDIDFYEALRTSTDTHVAIAIRGIGQMSADDLANPDRASTATCRSIRRSRRRIRRRRARVYDGEVGEGQRSVGRDGRGDDQGGAGC